jgi:AraC family transcriptional regulator of adaptative response/methylated-DNA-[protein]-cysteine methyltransferase
MLTTPSPETLYNALLARDPSYEGQVFAAISTTGIFCRLTCPARKPKFENTRFFTSIRACFEAGFRPCLRCRPLAHAGTREPLVAKLLAEMDARPGHVWSEQDLLALDLDPSTVRRTFKRHLGLTFLDLSRLRQTGRGLAALAAGASVIDAQLEAGFESGDAFRQSVNRLLGENPANLKHQDLLKADWLETPIGPMLAIASAHALHLLEFFDRKALPSELIRLRAATSAAIGFGRTAITEQVSAELAAYFAGTSATFATPLAFHGAGFTRRVWDRLQNIPPGTTRAYSDIAAELGQDTAYRAVARANGANQIAIIIPCHRVIGADGHLTGYGGGLWRKQWLISHEAAKFAG